MALAPDLRRFSPVPDGHGTAVRQHENACGAPAFSGKSGPGEPNVAVLTGIF